VSTVGGRLRTFMFGFAPKETSVARRGFHQAGAGADGGGGAQMRERTEHVGMTFRAGYHAALATPRAADLAAQIETIDRESRGWAYEGAAMGLSLLDILTPWHCDRVGEFIRGPAAAHTYMAHIGIGWALARLRRPLEKALHRLDADLRWLVLDGVGFHAGFFRWPRFRAGATPPGVVRGYGRRVFDQGLGRSLWFVAGGDAARIAAEIDAFAPPRRADLWSGIGLACAYAGGVDRPAIERLADAAGGDHRASAAQGAAFAAKARERAGNPAPSTEIACEVLCGRSAGDAAVVTDIAHAAIDRSDLTDECPAYERWREGVREGLAGRLSGREVTA